jgi:hypothetical protein
MYFGLMEIYRESVQCLRIFCYAVPHNLLKSLVLFSEALGMEIQNCQNVCRALTD